MAGELYGCGALAVNVILTRTAAGNVRAIREAIVPALLRAAFQPAHERRPLEPWADALAREPMLPTPPGAIVHAVSHRLGAQFESGSNLGHGQVLLPTTRGIGAGERDG